MSTVGRAQLTGFLGALMLLGIAAGAWHAIGGHIVVTREGAGVVTSW